MTTSYSRVKNAFTLEDFASTKEGLERQKICHDMTQANIRTWLTLLSFAAALVSIIFTIKDHKGSTCICGNTTIKHSLLAKEIAQEIVLALYQNSTTSNNPNPWFLVPDSTPGGTFGPEHLRR